MHGWKVQADRRIMEEREAARLFDFPCVLE